MTAGEREPIAANLQRDDGGFRPERILIAGASVRAAWQSASRGAEDAHWRTIEAADLFGDADLLDADRFWLLTPGYDNLVEVIEASRPDAWLYTGALENRPDLISQASRLAPLWGCSSECVTQVRDPATLDQVLRRNHCHYPPWTDSVVALPRDGSWLQKRRASAAGLGVTLYTGDGDQHDSIRRDSFATNDAERKATSECRMPAGDERWYYQRRMEGNACGAVFVGCDGRAWLWGVTQQWHGPRYGSPRPFQYAGSLGPRTLDRHEYNAWEQIGHVLCQNFPMEGIFGVDAIVTADAVVVVEVNPRWTASVEVLERATGRNAMRLHWQACCQRRLPTDEARSADDRSSDAFPADIHSHRLVGKAIVYARTAAVASADFLKWVRQQNAIFGNSQAWHRNQWSVIADVPRVDTQFDPGDPVVSVIVNEASGDAQAWGRLERRLTEAIAVTQEVLKRDPRV